MRVSDEEKGRGEVGVILGCDCRMYFNEITLRLANNRGRVSLRVSVSYHIGYLLAVTEGVISQ